MTKQTAMKQYMEIERLKNNYIKALERFHEKSRECFSTDQKLKVVSDKKKPQKP